MYSIYWNIKIHQFGNSNFIKYVHADCWMLTARRKKTIITLENRSRNKYIWIEFYVLSLWLVNGMINGEKRKSSIHFGGWFWFIVLVDSWHLTWSATIFWMKLKFIFIWQWLNPVDSSGFPLYATTDFTANAFIILLSIHSIAAA